MTRAGTIDVAVAVVVNHREQVLISFRHAGLHQGNKWEFPGGKVESGESVVAALRRELHEELGLEVQACHPLKIIEFQYPDKSVRLHVWRVTQWTGEARGLEGQEIVWKPVTALSSEDFPAANAPIVKLLQLPPLIAITPEVDSPQLLERTLEHLLKQQLTIVQIRQPALSRAEYVDWFRRAQDKCANSGVTLMFNGALADFKHCTGGGYHANSARLRELDARPVGTDLLFSASCHNLEELQRAEALQADYVTLSPVAKTAKYPESSVLGWEGFTALARQVNVPVYALGGLSLQDRATATEAGACGLCGISLFQSNL